jgi:hypothetical protein
LTFSTTGTRIEEQLMSRAWNLVGALALTALCFAPTGVRSSEPGSNPKPADLESLEKRLNAQFDTLNRKMDTASNQMAIISESIATLKRETTSLEHRLQEVERTTIHSGELQVLRDQVDHLRDELNAVRRSESQLRDSLKVNPNTIAAQGSPAPGAPSTDARYGTLRITNDFPFNQEVVVNGTPHVVAPLSSKDISVPVGTFTYYVVGYPMAVRTRTITTSRLFPIRIY